MPSTLNAICYTSPTNLCEIFINPQSTSTVRTTLPIYDLRQCIVPNSPILSSFAKCVSKMHRESPSFTAVSLCVFFSARYFTGCQAENANIFRHCPFRDCAMHTHKRHLASEGHLTMPSSPLYSRAT